MSILQRNDCFCQLQSGMWPEQHHNKDWIRFISAPLSESFLKKASVNAYVTSATKNMVDTEAVTQISLWKWWWASCVTLEDSPPSFTAQQLSSPLCQSYLSLFSLFFMELCGGWVGNTDAVYWLIAARGLEWSLLQDTSKYSWLDLYSANSLWADEEPSPLFLNEFLY